jgi:hypothetical protein
MKLLVSLVVFVVLLVSAWRMYEKAGQSGWVSLIPILNILGLLKMAGRPFWWILLYLIPVVNLIVHVIVSVDVARSFGRSALFGIAMAIPAVTPFCIAYLGLGDVRYQGPAAS